MKFNPNNKTKRVLKKFSKFVDAVDNKFFYVVMGGIAVDGYAGKLTRNHPDIDMLVYRDDVKRLENVLKKLGYPFEVFNHPQEKGYKYKIRTNDPDWTFTFQIIDKKANSKFEIGFYRDPHKKYDMLLIKPQRWLTLEGIRFPAVSKGFLIKLKQNEIAFFEKLKGENPKKYQLKRKGKHLKCLHDINLLKS